MSHWRFTLLAVSLSAVLVAAAPESSPWWSPGQGTPLPDFATYDNDQVIAQLKAHERELRAAGVIQLSLFGSVARGEAGANSDVDVAVKIDRKRGIDLFELGGLNMRLQDLLGASVDLITEPARRPRFQERIDQDRVLVF